MILRQATIKYSGVDPDDLKLKSNKRICISCDDCGRVRWVKYLSYTSLCGSCAAKIRFKNKENHPMYGKIGKDNPRFGMKHTNETKKLISKNHPNHKGENNPNYRNHKLAGENNPNYGIHKFGKDAAAWKGGYVPQHRLHVLPIKKCIKLNSRFIGSEGHHLNKDTVIFIPKELHKHIWHNFKSGQGMEEMNVLALQFISGEL